MPCVPSLSATVDDAGSVALDMLPLTEQGQGLVAGVECHMDHLGAFGDEDAFAFFFLLTQLGFCHGGEHPDLRIVNVLDFYDGHVRLIFRVDSYNAKKRSRDDFSFLCRDDRARTDDLCNVTAAL